MENVGSLLHEAARSLSEAGVPEARREAASLLAFTLERDRAFLIAHPEHHPAADQTVRFREYVARRSAREPFHYITGHKEFYGLDFAVSPAVLIPRPETELLVERGIAAISAKHRPTFCEVGVGSGCISIAILLNLPSARGVGLDISADALGIAALNAESQSVSSRLDLRESDLFAALTRGETFDLVISNPPYVPAAEISGLEPEVRDHEPHSALTDGAEGLSIIRELVHLAPSFLNAAGVLAFEFGLGQAEMVRTMFAGEVWTGLTIESDLQGIPRVAAARLR